MQAAANNDMILTFHLRMRLPWRWRRRRGQRSGSEASFRLEVELRHKLNDAESSLKTSGPEVRVGHQASGIEGQVQAIIKAEAAVRVVQDVECFRAKLNTSVFSELECLEQR